MRFHPEQLRILKELILDYQEEQREETFYKILQRIDPLLALLVRRFSKIYYYEEPTPQILQDLYQSAVHSVNRMALDFDPEIRESILPSWIYNTVRNELYTTYRVKKLDAPRYVYEHPNYAEKPSSDQGLIREDVQNTIQELLEKGIVSEEDMLLFQLVFIEKTPIRRIVQNYEGVWGRSWETVKNRSERIKRTLRREFREKGFGYD